MAGWPVGTRCAVVLGMLSYQSTTVINAAPEVVWAILTDLDRFPSWDPNCISIEGDLDVGSKLTILSKLAPNRAFTAKVVSLEENERMIWQGGMPLGAFRGVRTFELEKLSTSRTRFTTREEFSGWMSPLINKTIPDMTEAFDAFTSGMKKRAEHLARAAA